MKRILVIAAHPDDETLGAGGTIAKHIENGAEIKVLVLGTGITSRETENAEKEIAELRQEAKKAMDKLGVREIEFLDFPDNKFDSVPLLDIIKAIESRIEEFQPETVYTHHWGDLNLDHRIAFEAVTIACRPVSCQVKRILCFEIISSSEMNLKNDGSVFKPNYWVPLDEKQVGKKLEALREYQKEIREPPHPRSVENAKALASVRGSVINKEFAEAFVVALAIE